MPLGLRDQKKLADGMGLSWFEALGLNSRLQELPTLNGFLDQNGHMLASDPKFQPVLKALGDRIHKDPAFLETLEKDMAAPAGPETGASVLARQLREADPAKIKEIAEGLTNYQPGDLQKAARTLEPHSHLLPPGGIDLGLLAMSADRLSASGPPMPEEPGTSPVRRSPTGPGLG